MNVLQAQSYIKMIDTTNVWNVLCGGITTNGEDLRQTDKLQFKGDTIVNDTIYHKLFSQVFYTSNGSTLLYICALREDSVQQKVYRRNNLGAATTEELLYDFSLQPGDSVILSVDYDNRPNPIRVDSITTVYFAEKDRRIFHITSYYDMIDSWYSENYQWIEGIGKVDNFGKIIGPIKNFEWMVDELLCFWQSDQLNYSNPDYPTCLIVHVGLDEFENNGIIKTYPNPVKDKLNIEIEQPASINKLTIYNAVGQEQMKYNLHDRNTSLDISYLLTGVYLLKFENGNTVVMKKLIKN